jgi:hypothetical protein
MEKRRFVFAAIGLLLIAGLGACSTVAPTVAPPTEPALPTATMVDEVVQAPVAPDPTATSIAAVVAPTATPEPQIDAEEPMPVGGTPASIPGWATFTDATYGFTLQYPADWTYDEVDLTDPAMPPAGQMDRLIFFAPEGWDESFIALELEVYELDDEAFAATFIPATREEEVVREDGLRYTKLTHDYGQVTMFQVLFQSLANPDVRVVFTDYVTGWPDRLAGNEAVAETFTRMLATFQFID